MIVDNTQNESEIEMILSDCKNPIKREITPRERQSIHVLKQRKEQIQTDLLELDRTERDTRYELLKHDEEIGKAAKKLFAIREQLFAVITETNLIGDDLSGVPMVVGRNIGHVINPFISRPLESFDILSHTSKHFILLDRVERVLKLQKDASVRDENIWNSKLTWENEKSELERLKTRLSLTAAKIKDTKEYSQRSNINFAIHRFWQSGTTLFPIKDKLGQKTKISLRVSTTGYHVLTDFVLKTRLEEQKGSLRLANLIAELTAVQNCDKEYWDSGILFGISKKPIALKNKNRRIYIGSPTTIKNRMDTSSIGGAKCFQRYRKDVFIAAIKREIDLLIQSSQQHTPTKEISTVGGRCETNRQVQTSHDNYLKRKRDKYRSEIHKARSMTGFEIEVLDTPLQGRYTIKSCNVLWIDNGTKPLIKHKVQKYGEVWNSSANYIMLNLTKTRYFVYRNISKCFGEPRDKIITKVPKIANFHQALIKTEV